MRRITMILMLSMAVGLVGCSGLHTNTMNRKEAEAFQNGGYSLENVRLARPVRVGNYYIFHIVGERVNPIAQNVLDSIAVITDLDGNIITDDRGMPVGLFVTTRVNDGILHAGINGMWIAIGQVGSTVAQGEYDKDVARIRANAEQQVAQYGRDAAIGSAKWESRRGPESIVHSQVDNSTNTSADSGSSSRSGSENPTEIRLSSESYSKGSARQNQGQDQDANAVADQQQAQDQRARNEGSHADARAGADADSRTDVNAAAAAENQNRSDNSNQNENENSAEAGAEGSATSGATSN